MALLEKQLEIKKSLIPTAGKGLFTKKTIPKGARIIEYIGRITTWKEISKESDSNRYILYINKHHVIDARPYKKAIARYVNDARGIKKIKGVTNNAIYIEEELRVFIEAKKNIPAGSEILVGYGKRYWDNLKKKK